MRSTYWIAITLLAQGALAASCEGFGGHLDIGTGYRQDSIKILGDNPGLRKHRMTTEVSSSFHLKNLSVYELLGQYETDHYSDLYLCLYGSHGWITGGKETGFVPANLYREGKIAASDDATTSTSIRTKTILSEQTNAYQARGDTSDLCLRLGYRFFLANQSLSFAPFVGFGYQQLHTFIRHPSMAFKMGELFGVKISDAFSRIPQPIHFTAQSRGFLAGYEADWVVNSCWRIFAGGAWKWHRTNTSTTVEEQFFRPNKRIASSASATIAAAAARLSLFRPATMINAAFTSTDKFHPQGAEGHIGAFYSYGNWEIGARGEYEYLYTRNGRGNIKFSAFGSGLTRSTTELQDYRSNKAIATTNASTSVISFNREELARRFHWSTWSAQLLVGYNF